MKLMDLEVSTNFFVKMYFISPLDFSKSLSRDTGGKGGRVTLTIQMGIRMCFYKLDVKMLEIQSSKNEK